MAKIAFLGLGVMGGPMAGHLASSGHDVSVFNRTASRAADWVAQHGGRSAASPAQAAQGAEVVFACVGNDEDVRAVALKEEDGAFAGMAAGSVFVDHTTASASLARELHGLAAEKGFGFLDAPVSGGQSGAEQGILTVMTGGEEAVFSRVAPLMESYARRCRLMGPVGSGQLAKMVNQICIAGLVQGLAEGLHFAVKSGLDTDVLIETISQGAAQSWQMDNRAATMVEKKFDFGFAVDLMRKDLDICFKEAERNGARLPVAAQVDRYYAGIQDMGGGRWDTSSLIALLER